METQVRAVEVGDFFEESWGYDQTNVDFYQVVRVSSSGKTVWMRQVQTACVKGGDGGPADYVAPLADMFYDTGCGTKRDGLLKRLIRTYDYGNGVEVVVNMTSYSNAYLWDLKPAFRTGSGWGH